jgi:hypothetical protein
MANQLPDDFVERSLFVRSSNGLIELLDRIYLEQDATGHRLTPLGLSEAWEGVRKFNEVMRYIKKKYGHENPERYDIPTILHIEGHA